MKKVLKFILWFTAIPWFLHLFKAAFHDIPKASNQEVGDALYIGAWVLTFPLMMGLTAIWAFFTSIRWIFIHPYFIAPPSEETIAWAEEEAAGEKQCEYCKEWIRGDAVVCRYCLSDC